MRSITYQITWNDVAKAAALALLVLMLLAPAGWTNEFAQPTPATPSAEKSAFLDGGTSPSTSPANHPEMTQDFLMQDSPLSKPTAEDEQELTVVAVSGAGKECTASGDSEQGSQSCLERKEDGQFSEVKTEWENFGNESKRQTTTDYFLADGSADGKETVRIKTLFRSESNGNIVKLKDFFDIVKQPARGLITRELIVKEYDSQGSVTKATWAHYREIEDKKAGLAHHAVLYYKDGQLTAAFADQYKDGKKSETLLNYDPRKNPNLRLEQTGATKWDRWISQLIHQNPMGVA